MKPRAKLIREIPLRATIVIDVGLVMRVLEIATSDELGVHLCARSLSTVGIKSGLEPPLCELLLGQGGQHEDDALTHDAHAGRAGEAVSRVARGNSGGSGGVPKASTVKPHTLRRPSRLDRRSPCLQGHAATAHREKDGEHVASCSSRLRCPPPPPLPRTEESCWSPHHECT